MLVPLPLTLTNLLFECLFSISLFTLKVLSNSAFENLGRNLFSRHSQAFTAA